MYRGCYNGIMRVLGQPFCDVETDAFVKRLYGGGWGTPSTGVSLIEPGATPAASSLSVPQGTSVSFQAVVVGSRSTPGLIATWRVDGANAQVAPTTSGATVSFSFVVPDTRSHTIELVVVDNTPMSLMPTTRSRSWTVVGNPVALATSVVPGMPTLTSVVGGNGYASLAFLAPQNSGGSPIGGYIATCYPGGYRVSGSSLSLTIKGLTNGVTYSCSVAATNANGTGPASAAMNVTPAGDAGPALMLVEPLTAPASMRRASLSETS